MANKEEMFSSYLSYHAQMTVQEIILSITHLRWKKEIAR